MKDKCTYECDHCRRVYASAAQKPDCPNKRRTDDGHRYRQHRLQLTLVR